MCGLLLVLLGAWGALAPFIGPDLHFGYSPDSAFAYTEGRLVLSAVPGAVALLAGLIVLVTRSRGLGAVAGFLAALAGAWFIVGAVVVAIVPSVFKPGTVSAGVPLSTGTTMIALTELSFFAGTGALMVFFGALAMGRFSLLAAKDPGAAGTAATGIGAAYGGYQGGGQFPSVELQYPAAADPYAPADQDTHQPEPDQATATQDLGRAAGGANSQSDPQQYAAPQGYQATQYAGQQQYPAQQPDQSPQQDYQAQQYGSQQQYGGQQYGAQQGYGDQYPVQQDYPRASDNPISHEQYPATPASQPPFPPAPKPVGSADPTRTMDQPDAAVTPEPGSPQW